MKRSLKINNEEIKILLTCINNFKCVGYFNEIELEKIKRKFKYHLSKGEFK